MTTIVFSRQLFTSNCASPSSPLSGSSIDYLRFLTEYLLSDPSCPLSRQEQIPLLPSATIVFLNGYVMSVRGSVWLRGNKHAEESPARQRHYHLQNWTFCPLELPLAVSD